MDMGGEIKWVMICFGIIGLAAGVSTAVEHYAKADVAKTAMEHGYRQIVDSSSGEVLWVPDAAVTPLTGEKEQ